LAELKFFFVFFVVMLVIAAMLTAFSWRKLLIFATGGAVIAVTSALLVTLFDFEGFLSFENIWKAATQKHYSSDQTVNRLSASLFSAGSRVRTGTYGQNTDTMTEYIVYVKKVDYERAMGVIHS
jgi:hypothetical protein